MHNLENRPFWDTSLLRTDPDARQYDFSKRTPRNLTEGLADNCCAYTSTFSALRDSSWVTHLDRNPLLWGKSKCSVKMFSLLSKYGTDQKYSYAEAILDTQRYAQKEGIQLRFKVNNEYPDDPWPIIWTIQSLLMIEMEPERAVLNLPAMVCRICTVNTVSTPVEIPS